MSVDKGQVIDVGTSGGVDSATVGFAAADSVAQPGSSDEISPKARIQAFLTNRVFHIAALATIILVCYGRTVTSYFLADDFGHIGYIHSMFKGHWNMFWCNFTGNFMGIEAIKVYRPAQIMCEMIDYTLFRANAAGWYSMNLAYFIGSVSCFYLVARKLVASWGESRSSAAAFFAATVFALSPLKCESVSWMVGRIDIVTSFAYLLSLLFFLKKRTRTSVALSVVFFSIALLLKEMPVGLPIVITALTFFGLPEKSAEVSSNANSIAASNPAVTAGQTARPSVPFFQSVLNSFKVAAPWWATLAVYFCIRRLALGTFGGGYAAGMGGGTLESQMHRWFDPDTARRLFFPFNFAVMPEPNIYASILTVAYAVLIGILAVRLILGAIPWRLTAFCAVWLLMCAVPIYQLWGIGYDLEGGRFYYFLSMPLALLTSMVAFAPLTRTVAGRELKRLTFGATALGACAAVAVTFAFSRMAIATNAAWVNAGKEVRRFKEACIKESAANKGQPIAVLNAPRRHAGAHQLLNGTTVQTLFIPPFSETNLADKFISFEPIMFSPPGLVNATRLKSVVAAGVPIFAWSSQKNRLERANLEKSAASGSVPAIELFKTASDLSGTENSRLINAPSLRAVGHGAMTFDGNGITLTGAKSDDAIEFTNVNARTADYDYLEIDASFKGGAPVRTVRVAWTAPGQPLTSELLAENVATERVKSDENSNSSKVYVNLSHRLRWRNSSMIDSIYILPDAANSVEIKSVRLVPASAVSPLLAPQSVGSNLVGIVDVTGKSVDFKIDLRGVNAASLRVEVSKPNCFFDNFDKNSADSPVSTSIPLAVNADVLTLNGKRFSKCFPSKGYYQLRCVSLDAEGEVLGSSSDEVTIKVR